MENQLFIALRQNKLLKNVDISKINLDEVKGNLLTISEGEILYREGDKADTLYLVVSGEINIIKKRMLGKTKSYLFVENDFLGHDEFFEETSRTSTAVALRDSYLIALSKAETDYLIRLDEEVYINLHVPANEIDEETLNQRAELKITKDHEESKHKTFDESPSDIDDKTENQADEFFKSIADSSRVEEIKVIQPSEESKEEPETETKPPFEKEAIDFRDTSIFYEDGTPKSKFDLPSTENLPSEEIPMEKEKIPSSTREILDKDGIPKPEFEFTETSELQSEEKSSQGNLNDKIYQILNGGDASLPEIPESLKHETFGEADEAFLSSLSLSETPVKNDLADENIVQSNEKDKIVEKTELTKEAGMKGEKAPISKPTIRDFKTAEILAEADERLHRIEKGESVFKADNWRTMPDSGRVLDADQLQMIIKAAELVNSTVKIDEVLKNIVEVAMYLTKADRGTLYIINSEKNELWSFVAMGDEIKEIRLKIGEGLAGYVAQTGETINIKNVQSDPRFKAYFDKVSGYKTKNMICFPIKNNKNKIIGVLQLLNSKSGEFTKRDEEFLSAISIHSALALQNANMVEKLLQIERVQSLGKMANFLIQDIKKPILVSKRYVEHLKSKELTPENAQIVEMLFEQLSQVADLVQITSSYSESKTMIRMLNASLNNTLIDYAARIGTYVESRRCQIIPEYDKDATVKLDVKEFYQCYLHIVKNACDAMPEGGNIYISTKRDDKQKKVMIYFKDNGLGIHDILKDKIFEPFMTYGKKDGTGLGLSITKKVVEAHNGIIEVQSALGEGATFTVTLPVISAF